jgi:hypothetical protein
VSPPDCACSIARTVCVEIDSISADGTRRVAVPVFVRVCALVADCTRRPAIAVAVSADVLPPTQPVVLPYWSVWVFWMLLPTVPVVEPDRSV